MQKPDPDGIGGGPPASARNVRRRGEAKAAAALPGPCTRIFAAWIHLRMLIWRIPRWGALACAPADALHRPGELSGGERLRAGLTCALGAVPPSMLLILDEPTNHLDLDGIAALGRSGRFPTGRFACGDTVTGYPSRFPARRAV